MKTIEELADVKGGKRIPKGYSLQKTPNSHPYIKVNCLTGRIIEEQDFEFVPDDCFEKISRYIVNTGDLVLSVVGTVGLTSIIDEKLNNASLTENCVKITGLSSRDSHFIYYYLNSRSGRLEIQARTVGSTQPKLPMYNIKSLPVPWPEEAYREKVVDILLALDKKVELNQKVNKILEKVAQSIYKSWFVDFDPVHAKKLALEEGLTPAQAERAAMAIISGVCSPSEFAENFEEMNGKLSEKLSKMSKEKQEELAYTASLFPNNFEVTELGKIPKGWKYDSIYEFAKIIYGAPFSSKKFTKEGEGKPLIRIRDLKTFSPQHWTTEQHKKGHLVQTGNLLIGMDAEFKPTIWLGDEAYLNQRVMLIEPKNQVSTAFMRFALEEPMAFFERAKVGTTVIHLGKGDVDTIKLVMPNNQILKKYGELGNNIFQKIVFNQLEIKKMEQLRNTLLPRLLSGEIDLTNINLEEIK